MTAANIDKEMMTLVCMFLLLAATAATAEAITAATANEIEIVYQ
jgi:hypothetical protein